MARVCEVWVFWRANVSIHVIDDVGEYVCVCTLTVHHCGVFADWLICCCDQISTLRLLTQALLCALDAWRASSTNIWARFILCWKWRHSYKITHTHRHTRSPLLSYLSKFPEKRHTHTDTHTVETHLQRRRRFPHWGWHCDGSGKTRWRPHRALRGTADLHSWWGRYWRHAQHLYTQTHTRRRMRGNMFTTDRYKRFVQCKDATFQNETENVFKYITYCTYYILYILYWHFCKMCRIMFRLHVYDLTFISWGEGDSGGVTGKKAVKHSDRSSRQSFNICKGDNIVFFCKLDATNIFKKISGLFPAMFVATQEGYFWHDVLHFHLCLWRPIQEFEAKT